VKIHESFLDVGAISYFTPLGNKKRGADKVLMVEPSNAATVLNLMVG
jgi:hypothetical protein